MASSIALSGCTQPANNSGVIATERVNVTIEAFDQDGAQAVYGITKIETGSSGFDAMLKLFGEDNLEYTDYGPGMGVMIESISGYSPPENYFWELSVNGELSMVGISQVVIEDDTVLHWEMTEIEEYSG